MLELVVTYFRVQDQKKKSLLRINLLSLKYRRLEKSIRMSELSLIPVFMYAVDTSFLT